MLPYKCNLGPESVTMLKVILVSLAFLLNASALQPIPFNSYNYTLSNTTYTITSDNPLVTREVSAKIKIMEKEITKKWLDEPIPRGMRHIKLYVYIRPYNKAYCTPDLEIHIYSNRKHLDETLRHELTHALLFIRYPDLPRWTHEGAATSWDGPGHQKKYQHILAWSRKSGTYPILEQIMTGTRFNRYNTTAYAASNSLVKFLLSRSDRYTLFLYASGKTSLQRAYGFRNILELQYAWINWLNAPVEAQRP